MTPGEKLFVANGRKTYFYVPRDRQVTVGDWASEPASTPLLFLLGQACQEIPENPIVVQTYPHTSTIPLNNE